MASTQKEANKNVEGISSLFREAGHGLRLELSSEVFAGSEARQSKIFDIIQYIEQPWGLNMRLYPAQRMITKLFYNIPLDDKLPEDEKLRIKVPDMFNTYTRFTFTEKEYLKYLFELGRCNIGEQDHERRQLILSIGRRSGKTTLAGVFASYEIYRLLNLVNPQQYYGLPNGNRIQIISVATDKEQAGLLFNEVATHAAKCDYFKPFVSNNTLSHINFRTPYDIEKFGPVARLDNGKFVSLSGKATLRVTFRPCVAKGLRGAGNIMVILDEVAHFQDKGQTSAEDIYNAVTPSTAAFSPKGPDGMPIDGSDTEVDSRIILISSPLGKSGKFFELFDLAMHGGEGAKNLLAIQAPTWEINPTVPTSYYRQKYHENPTVFSVEHGAEFSDQAVGWIEREVDLQACIDPELRPVEQGYPKAPYQMGIDVGLKGDGTAVAITQVLGDKIQLVYHEVWYAGEDWKESNPHLEDYSCDYAKLVSNEERLDFDAIGDWIYGLTRRFHISDGIFDRWNGIPLEQTLHKRGLSQFTSEFFTRDQRSKIYQAVKMFMLDERLVLYDFPLPNVGEKGTEKHSPLISELLTLQATMISKNLVMVAAPKKQGAHDDLSDALTRAIWLSIEKVTDTKHAAGGRPGYYPTIAVPVTTARYHVMRARKHGGFGDRPSLRGLGIRRAR